MQAYRRPARRNLAPRSRRAITGLGAYRKKPAARRMAPRRRYVSGRGAYYVQGGIYGQGKLGPFKGGASLAGGYSSGNFTAPKLTGLGAYSISNIRHNVLIKPDIPEVRNSVYAEGGTIIRHREYLGPIVTSAEAGAFRIETYPLNPAQQASFPWLSTIAQNYEEYRPNGVLFEFRSTASDAIASSTNLALGQVMMCTQYDSTDPPFSSDIAMLNYSWAQSGKVSDTIQHFVECDPKQSPLSHLYTRVGSNPSTSDLRFSDFGVFSIATSGLQGASVQVGQLWVTYEFILYKPKLGDQEATAGGWFHYSNTGATVVAPEGTGTPVYDAENNIDASVSGSMDNDLTITLPNLAVPVSYQINVVVKGSSTASVGAMTYQADVNLALVQHNDGNNANYVAQPTVASTTTTSSYMTWVSTQPNVDMQGPPYITLGSPATFPASANVDVYVVQIPYLDPSIYG